MAQLWRSIKIAILFLALIADCLSAAGAIGAKAGGFVGGGTGFGRDYGGSDGSEAGPASFGRITWVSGRFVNPVA